MQCFISYFCFIRCFYFCCGSKHYRQGAKICCQCNLPEPLDLPSVYDPNSSLLAYPTSGSPLLYPNRALSSLYPTTTITYPNPTLPYPTLLYPTLPPPYSYRTATLLLPYCYPTLPYPTLPYPTLPYPTATLPYCYPTLPYSTLTYPSPKLQPWKGYCATLCRAKGLIQDSAALWCDFKASVLPHWL